jgi:hypothetical protein|nr:MAG TPA: hypothetical protein [Caudoviricetes sp.]
MRIFSLRHKNIKNGEHMATKPVYKDSLLVVLNGQVLEVEETA